MLTSLMLDHGALVAFLAVMTVFSLRSAVLAGGAQCWISESEWPKHHKVVLPHQERTDWKRDMIRGFQILAFDALIFAVLLHTGLLSPERNPSGLGVATTVVVFFAWYEVYFYFSHRALHHPKLFWIHRFHHEGRGTTPWTSVAFSLSERIVLDIGAFGPVALLSHWIPISLEGFGLYFLINYTLNVYGHMNVEIAPAWLRNSFLFRWTGTSVSHGLHHLRFRGHYGLFTRFLDVWLGTDFADYPAVFDKVVSGKGAL